VELLLHRYPPRFGDKPALRPIEIGPVQTAHGRMIGLKDPLGYADGMAVLSQEAFVIASLFDGHHTLSQIQGEIMRRHGQLIFIDRLASVARALDKAGFLDGPSFERRKAKALEKYRAQPNRRAVHAGAAYEGDPNLLHASLTGLFTHPDGPGGLPRAATAGPRVKGLIAPHIDLHRGGPAYAHAYRTLFEGTDADLFVVFGTAHASPAQMFTLTTQDYDTPFGALPTDALLAEHLIARLGTQLVAEEVVHANEHSIEFQAVWLRYLYPDREIRMLPVLCSSLYSHWQSGVDPQRDEAIARFLAELGELTAERNVCFVAAADLSHVGLQFGDRTPPGPPQLEALGKRDLQTMSLVEQGDAQAFYRDVAPDAETRRICGLTPIYMTMRSSGSTGGRLLRYAQWFGPDAGSSVTYAAAALY
jgi:hypothetical protein